MGRKGNSKRKPKQTKEMPAASDKVSGSVSAAMQAVDSSSTRTYDTSKTVAKSSPDRKNNSKKK